KTGDAHLAPAWRCRFECFYWHSIPRSTLGPVPLQVRELLPFLKSYIGFFPVAGMPDKTALTAQFAFHQHGVHLCNFYLEYSFNGAGDFDFVSGASNFKNVLRMIFPVTQSHRLFR